MHATSSKDGGRILYPSVSEYKSTPSGIKIAAENVSSILKGHYPDAIITVFVSNNGEVYQIAATAFKKGKSQLVEQDKKIPKFAWQNRREG